MGYNNVYIISIKRFLSLTLEPVKEGSMQKFKEHKLGVAIIFSLMFLTPFMENTRGIFIPIFKDDFGVSNTAISSMITIVSLLGMGVTLIGGAVIEKIGQKKTIIIGIVHLIVGIVIQSQAKTFPVFFLGLFPIIAGINFYNVAANTIVPLIFVGSSAIAMNLLHFMYGAGSTVSQNAAGFLLDQKITWRTMYLFVALFYVIVLVAFIMAKIPEEAPVEKTEKGPNMFKNPLLYAFGLALGFYVFSEQGISLWLTNYLKEGYGLRESVGARYLGLFFLIFSLGRLFGGFFVQKRDVLKTVFLSQTIALGLLGSGILLGKDFIVVISVSGLFYAIVFPSVMSLVSKVFPEKPGFATGFMITMVALVLNTMNLIMGILTDVIGPNLSIYLLPFSMLVSMGFITYIRRKVDTKLVKKKAL